VYTTVAGIAMARDHAFSGGDVYDGGGPSALSSSSSTRDQFIPLLLTLSQEASSPRAWRDRLPARHGLAARAACRWSSGSSGRRRGGWVEEETGVAIGQEKIWSYVFQLARISHERVRKGCFYVV
jgi:hypothetical protein